MRRERLGPLDVVIADDDGVDDGLVCVLLHGFGAPGTDLVGLAEWIDAPAGTRWVFPAAPLDLGGLFGDSRAWWMIDLARLERELDGSHPPDRAREVPAGLPEARAAVLAVLDDVRAKLGVADERVVLGGFSQGAMLSLDVALHSDRAFAGLVLMSGTLIAEHEWAPRMAARRGLPVVQSHGERDGLLPFSAAERLRDLLRGAGLDVTWIPFRGQHEIPPPVVKGVSEFLRQRAGGPRP
jgi:phospholipase/carboxylesterase